LDENFDYVTIIITLCFVKDPEKVLHEAGRVLKRNEKPQKGFGKGGFVVISAQKTNEDERRN